MITQETYQAIMDDRKELFLEAIEWRDIAADLSRQRDDLLFALNRLVVACPNSLGCIDLHHSKEDRHNFFERCRPLEEYIEALAGARKVINAARKVKG